jgi:hypothetical protein
MGESFFFILFKLGRASRPCNAAGGGDKPAKMQSQKT